MEDLNKLEAEINKKFNETGDKHTALQKALKDAEQELIKLQGEYRLIQNLKKKTDTLQTNKK